MHTRLFLLLPLLWSCNGDVSVTKVTVDADSDGFDDTVDCDDGRAVVYPDAPELCDGADNDCDGAIDEETTDGDTYYLDADGDGAGSAATVACEQPEGHVTEGADCDDAEPRAFPGNPEVCDEIDNDCDGAVDDDPSDIGTWYADADGDGYGDPARGVRGCERPVGHVPSGTDCDDASAGVSPAGSEVCDEADVDEDCSGAADDEDAGVTGGTTSYRDADGDGYGNPGSATTACETPAGNVANDEDCDDASAGVSPAGSEVCDPADVDEDCDGLADNADPSVTGTATTWPDSDADGFGDAAGATDACDAPTGNVTNDQDCDDNEVSVSPAELEVCDDEIDNNCDSVIDEECGGCGSGSEPAVIDTYNYGGMSLYPLDIEDCLGIGIECCAPTTTQEQMDAFCELAGYCEATDWVVETMTLPSCYCWGACTGDEWYSPCCSGTQSLRVVTSVTCE